MKSVLQCAVVVCTTYFEIIISWSISPKVFWSSPFTFSLPSTGMICQDRNLLNHCRIYTHTFIEHLWQISHTEQLCGSLQSDMPHFKFNIKLLSVETHSWTVNRKCAKTLLNQGTCTGIQLFPTAFFSKLHRPRMSTKTTCYHATEIPKDQVSITERRPWKTLKSSRKS